MIGVNVSGVGAKNVKEAIDKEKLPWRSFIDPGPAGRGAIATQWNAISTPTYYVLDPNGVIRHKWAGAPGPKVIDTALERLLEDLE